MNIQSKTVQQSVIEVHDYDLHETIKYINDNQMKIVSVSVIQDARSGKYSGKFILIAEKEAQLNEIKIDQAFGDVAAGSKITGVSIGRIG